MNLIHKLAKERNIPAFYSLHQPPSFIWQKLDYIMLLAPGGYVCYYGKQQDIVPYFSNIGYPVPNNTNPAEC